MIGKRFVDVGNRAERLSPRRPARHSTSMPNVFERAVAFAAVVRFMREAGRIVVAFTCLSLWYLGSGIPFGALTDVTPTPSAGAHTGARSLHSASDSMTLGRVGSRVVADSFWSQALGIRKQFVVYLPPSYESNNQRRYPVAYYLHGMWGDEWNWVRAGSLNTTLDS